MATITPGKIVLIVICIFFIYIALFPGTTVVAKMGEQSPDSLCKWNAAMNSVTPMHAWLLAPNFACHARAVVLDAEGKTTVFKNELGNVEECSCDQFYGPLIDFSPSLTIDNDMLTYSRIPVSDNKSEISMYVYDETELGSLRVYFNDIVSTNYTIYTKEKRFFWTNYEKCTEGVIVLEDEINEPDLAPLECSIDETQGSAIKITFKDIDRNLLPIEIKEIEVNNVSLDKIPIKNILFKYYTINDQQDKCISDSNAMGTKHCTPVWQRRWVTKRLAELVMRCWQMGGSGGYWGDFDCFVGCVYYNSDESDEIYYTTLEQALDDNYFRSSTEDEYVPYNSLITMENIAVEETDSLKNGKCFYIKYHRGDLLLITVPGMYAPIIIPADKPRVILTFGRTVEEARRDL
ncbi:MAG: hypothetical protein JSW73_04830 [Candidatus Woesearchaeota archaeon]|nr:MAG: hypothetical protein JSW73_04830 [Candidatus Woesearchaeota archaeon]